MRNPRYAHAPRLPEGDQLDPGQLFSPRPPHVELEIGSGRGGFLFERLEAVTDCGVIGLEIRLKWATIVDERLRARGLGDRARAFAEDARHALPRLAPSSLRSVFIHFPDPWWKKKHHKRLVVTPELCGEIVRILEPAGQLFVQTDVEERAQAYHGVLDLAAGLEPIPGGPWLPENPFNARSPREHRAIRDGLPVFRLGYQKSQCGSKTR